MITHHKVASSAVAASIVMIGIYPNSIAASVLATSSCIMYAFLAFIEKKESHLAKDVRVLQDKVQTLMLAKGLGR